MSSSGGGPAFNLNLPTAGSWEEGFKNLAGYIVGQTLGDTHRRDMLDNWESFGQGVEKDIGKPTRQLFNIDGARDKRAQDAADAQTAVAEQAAQAQQTKDQLTNYQSDLMASRATARVKNSLLPRGAAGSLPTAGGSSLPVASPGKYLGTDQSSILGM